MKNQQKGSVPVILSIVVVVLVLGVAGFLIWGFTTNWGKSFDDESVSRYCYTACVNTDRPKYCTPDLIVTFKADNSPQVGSKWANTSCRDLAMNDIVQTCEDIKCP